MKTVPITQASGYYRTPVVALKKKERSIVLIGAIHTGLPSYYGRIQTVMDTLGARGYKVGYEGADEATLEQAIAAESSRLTMNLRHKAGDVIREGFIRLGLTAQGYAITPRANWAFIDPMITQLALDNHRRSTNDDFRRMAACDPVEAVRPSIQALLRLCETAIQTEIEVPKHGAARLHQRNEMALESILEWARAHDVVSCWGAAHLVGMVPSLEKAGFKFEAERWWPCMPTTLPDASKAAT